MTRRIGRQGLFHGHVAVFVVHGIYAIICELVNAERSHRVAVAVAPPCLCTQGVLALLDVDVRCGGAAGGQNVVRRSLDLCDLNTAEGELYCVPIRLEQVRGSVTACKIVVAKFNVSI